MRQAHLKKFKGDSFKGNFAKGLGQKGSDITLEKKHYVKMMREKGFKGPAPGGKGQGGYSSSMGTGTESTSQSLSSYGKSY